MYDYIHTYATAHLPEYLYDIYDISIIYLRFYAADYIYIREPSYLPPDLLHHHHHRHHPSWAGSTISSLPLVGGGDDDDDDDDDDAVFVMKYPACDRTDI